MEILEQPTVCVDASFYLTILLPDEDDSASLAVWQGWQDAEADLCVPPGFPWECANAVRQAVKRERVTAEWAHEAITRIMRCAVTIVPVEEHLMFAWRDFVVAYDMPAVYDAAYLALASHLDCELWTADLRLYRTVGHALPWVRAVGFED